MVAAAAPADVRDLVFQPVSPSLGGSPLNGAHVLGLAGANNLRIQESPQSKKDRRAQAALQGDQSPQGRFARQIAASLLSQIATTVGQRILGENARDSGVFSVGSTRVQSARAGGQINIDINDTATGGRNRIAIPAPQF